MKKIKCGHCGKENEMSGSVCRYCGYLIDEAKADFETFFTIEAFHFGTTSLSHPKKVDELYEEYLKHLKRLENKRKQLKKKSPK